MQGVHPYNRCLNVLRPTEQMDSLVDESVHCQIERERVCALPEVRRIIA
jgi:hypothetical protein